MFVSNEIKSFNNLNCEMNKDIVSFLDIIFYLHEKKSRTTLNKLILSGFSVKSNGEKFRIISYFTKELLYNLLKNKKNVCFEIEDLDKDLLIRYLTDSGKTITFKIYCINPSFRKNIDEKTSREELQNLLIHLPTMKFHKRMFSNYILKNETLIK